MSDPGASLKDAPARRTATTEFGRNLVVLAGAGTGKTGLLVERVLTAIGAGIAPVERIAAITFTEKAAAEMKERLAVGLERLRRLASDPIPPDPDQPADRAFRHLREERSVPAGEIARRSLAALTRLDRAWLGTIHNFCAEILRAHPVEARVDPGFAVDPGERFHALFEEAWESYLAQEVGPAARRPELWTQVLARVRPKELREIARALSSFVVPEEALGPPYAVVDPLSLFGDEAKALIAKAEKILARPHELTPVNEEYFQLARAALAEFLEGGVRALQRHLLADPRRKKRIETGTGPRRNLAGMERREFKATVHDSKHLLLGLLSMDEDLTSATLEALAPFARSLRERYLAQGLVGFDGLLSLARDLLRDHVEVREELKHRIQLLLVDEFQDTDPVQYEIVLFLAEPPGRSAKNAYEAQLEPGRLFVVGDPKQSIYRFRGADYAAFRRSVERIVACGGKTLTLETNFRSEPSLLSAVNRLFEGPRQESWEESEVQPAYVPIDARRSAAPDRGAVEAWTVVLPDGARAEDRRAAEGRVLAREILRWVEEERTCGYGEITILLRAFTPLADYLRPLREAGIPFIVDGGREFLKRPEVGHLLAALRAVALPSDNVALLSFLRSPAGGVPDDELAAYAASGGAWSFRAPVEASRFPRIAAAFEILGTLRDEARDLSPDALVRRVVARTSLLPLNAAAFEGAQRVANLRKLAATATELARDGKLSLLEVVDALEEGRLTEIDSDSPLADEGADAVRVMTIHKAKGLENRVIVLADLSRGEKPRGADAEPVKVARTDGGPSIALRVGASVNAMRVFWDRVEERHTFAEDVRLLYVALTRARERLVVLAGQAPQARGAASPWTRALAAWDYDPGSLPLDRAPLCDGAVLHRLMPPPPLERARGEALRDDTAGAVAAYERARDAFLKASPPHLALPSSLEAEGTSARTSPVPAVLAGGSRSVAKAAGTAVHRWLQAWDGKRSARDQLGSLDRLAESSAREAGVDPASVAPEAKEIVRAFLDSPLATRLREMRVRGKEVPLLLHRDGATWWGTLDLLGTDAAGKHVVVDFKTDRDQDPNVIADRYREQVGIYREAVRVALGLQDPPRAELWLLRHGTIVEV